MVVLTLLAAAGRLAATSRLAAAAGLALTGRLALVVGTARRLALTGRLARPPRSRLAAVRFTRSRTNTMAGASFEISG